MRMKCPAFASPEGASGFSLTKMAYQLKRTSAPGLSFQPPNNFVSDLRFLNESKNHHGRPTPPRPGCMIHHSSASVRAIARQTITAVRIGRCSYEINPSAGGNAEFPRALNRPRVSCPAEPVGTPRFDRPTSDSKPSESRDAANHVFCLKTLKYPAVPTSKPLRFTDRRILICILPISYAYSSHASLTCRLADLLTC